MDSYRRFQESGLYYLQSRYYDPELGRFINADGLITTEQSLLGNNLFTYCLNNPVNQHDMTGKAPANTFVTQDSAENDARLYIGSMSFVTGWEYAAIVYRVPARYERIYTERTYVRNGQEYTRKIVQYKLVRPAYYSYFVATTKNPIRVAVPDKPLGARMTSVSHTHPYYTQDYLINVFSSGDMNVSKKYGVPMYLYGADGSLRKYDPCTNSIEYYLYVNLPKDPHLPG